MSFSKVNTTVLVYNMHSFFLFKLLWFLSVPVFTFLSRFLCFRRFFLNLCSVCVSLSVWWTTNFLNCLSIFMHTVNPMAHRCFYFLLSCWMWSKVSFCYFCFQIYQYLLVFTGYERYSFHFMQRSRLLL